MRKLAILRLSTWVGIALMGILPLQGCEEQGVAHTHKSDTKDSRGNNIGASYSVTHTHAGGASRSHDYAYWNHYHAQPTSAFPNHAVSHSHVYDGTPNNPGHPACHNWCPPPRPDTPPTPREATPTRECSGTASGTDINPPSWLVGYWKAAVTIPPSFIEEGNYPHYWVGHHIHFPGWYVDDDGYTNVYPSGTGNGEVHFSVGDVVRYARRYRGGFDWVSTGEGNTSDEPVDRSDGCIRFYLADAWHTFIKESETEIRWHLSSKVWCGNPHDYLTTRIGKCHFQGGDGEHTVLRVD